ncbi:41756_t:CDS:2, partial [Gigaspora margarita]
KNWDNDCKSSINLCQPIFNNSLGIANIRDGNVIIESKEKIPVEIKSTEESNEQNNGIVKSESKKLSTDELDLEYPRKQMNVSNKKTHSYDKKAIEEAKQAGKVNTKILSVLSFESQLIRVDLLDEGLYFGFDRLAFKFLIQICSIDILRQALEILYYFK